MSKERESGIVARRAFPGAVMLLLVGALSTAGSAPWPAAEALAADVSTLGSTPEAIPAPVDEQPGQDTGLPRERTIPELESHLERLERDGAAPLARGVALRELALLYQGADRSPEALEAARKAVALLETAGDADALARAYNRLGVVHWVLARYDSAVVNLERARAGALTLGDGVFLGQIHNNLGAAHYQWGNYELAMEAFLQALEYRRAARDEAGEARVLANVGLTYQDWGRFDVAEESLHEAVRIADRLGDASMQGYARLILGNLYRAQGAWDRAELAYTESLDFYIEEHQANSLIGLARVASLRGEPARALPILDAVLAEARELDQPRREAMVRLARAEALVGLGRDREALEELDQALQVARAWEQRPLTLEILDLQARVHERLGRPGDALGSLRSYQALRDSLFSQNTAQRMAVLEARTQTEEQARENERLREEQRVQDLLIGRQRLIGLLGGGLLAMAIALLGALLHFNRRGRARERLLHASNEGLEAANLRLQVALDRVRTLEGLIPICSNCKRVRGDTGYWEAVESYITARSQAHFSHSICTECGPVLYGEDWEASEEVEGFEDAGPQSGERVGPVSAGAGGPSSD